MIITITCGLPGCGKSTMVRYLKAEAKHNVQVFSPDERLYHRGQYSWTAERCAAAWNEEYRRFGEALKMAGPRDQLVWDAVFTTRIKRSALVNISRGFGAYVEAWYFQTPVELCRLRNNARTPDRRVPDDIFEGFVRTFEPPTIDEGLSISLLDGTETRAPHYA